MDFPADPGSRSTRGASKQRRELINIEIQKIRDLLPLNSCVKDRLFQLQVMSLACIYIRKHKYLPYILQTCGKNYPLPYSTATPRGCDSCKALRGFLLMVTKEGKLLYISDNASEYLGYSVEEIMCQGDSLYDLVDVRDHLSLRNELYIGPLSGYSEYYPHESVFVCRMNLSRTAKRQVQYYKFVLVQGRYIHSLEHYKAINQLMQASHKIQPLFSAFCQPLINPENAESLAMGNPNIFCMVLSMDLLIKEMNLNAKEMLGYNDHDYINLYSIIHPEDLIQLSENHCKLIRDKEGIIVCLIRLENASKKFIWLHSVFVCKLSPENCPFIQATFQAVGQQEGLALQKASWVYCPSTYQSMRDKEQEFEVSSPESSASHVQDKTDGHEILETKPLPRVPDLNNNNNNNNIVVPKILLDFPDPANEFGYPFPEPLSLCPASLFGYPLPELGDDLDEYFRQVEQESPSSRKREHSQTTPSTASTTSCYDYDPDPASYPKIKRESMPLLGEFHQVEGGLVDYRPHSTMGSWTGLPSTNNNEYFYEKNLII
ncbi:unnamed protein product [Bursaphelenchus xylophilus]|uniref:(pine wood nematode) hypothetical protein n=1 Tax=Bursaphelenchus xylophilus TaxID=6326 RepID=A0A1I7RNU5_BURXY|nr:unnamed protein product [Bursaphelenchus xylophilus]CAG9124303.1 unnamed protein product [Bursaphelenchus xylophilus]